MPEEVVEIAEGGDDAAVVNDVLVPEAENAEEQQVENVEGEQEEQQTEGEQETDEQKAAKEDAEFDKQLQERGIPAKYKDVLKKEPFLRHCVMGYRSLRAEFPNGVKEAKEYRDVVLEFGGKEGIEALKSDAEAIDTLDSLISEGKPEALDAIIETSKDGFVKLMPSALEKFREADPEQYNHVLGRVVFNTLRESPIVAQERLLVEAYNALVKANDKESAAKLAAYYNSVEEFYKNIETLASKQPEKKIDPEREKLESEKKQFAEQQQQEFTKGVTAELRLHHAKSLDAEMAKQFKAAGKDYDAFKKKSPESAQVMIEKAYADLIKRMNADTTFVKQHDQLLSSRQKDKLIALMKDKTGKIVPEVAKNTYRLFNFGAPAAKKPLINGKDGKPPAPGTIRLSGMPDPAKVDRQRTTDDMIFENKAYLIGKKELHVWA